MVCVNAKQQIAELTTGVLDNPATWDLLDIAQIRAGMNFGTVSPQVGSIAMLLKLPPGLALPLSAVRCLECGLDVAQPGAQCLCD